MKEFKGDIEMNKKRELAYGKNAVHFLFELSQYESGEDFIGGDFDVYGEDENGAEGSAAIDIVELAADAYQIINDSTEALRQLHDYVEDMHSAQYAKDWIDGSHPMSLARAAIAKALGE